MGMNRFGLFSAPRKFAMHRLTLSIALEKKKKRRRGFAVSESRHCSYWGRPDS
jgi:hypothetical protein